jgi:hypothetical protein
MQARTATRRAAMTERCLVKERRQEDEAVASVISMRVGVGADPETNVTMRPVT